MRARLALLAIATAVLTLWPASASGSTRGEIVAVDSSSHPEVTLTVEPPDALAGVDLDASAFALTENGEPVDVTVERTSEQAGVRAEHLNVVLVIDTSGSMQGAPLAGAKTAAEAFLAELPAGTHLGIVAFGDTPVLAAEVGDPGTAGGAIAGLEARGETALYDALLLGLEQLGGEEGARDALIVLSDGGDTASAATLDATAEALRAAGVEFAAVELVTPEYDGSALRTLAGAAGGSVLSAADPGQLADVYGDVAATLLNRYSVTYTSGAGGDTSIRLTVHSGDTTTAIQREIRLPAAGGVSVAAPESKLADEPGWLASKPALYTGLGILFGLFAVMLSWTFLRPREKRISLAERYGNTAQRLHLPAISDWAARATDAAQRRLERSGRETTLYDALERAGLALRPGEFVVLAAVATVTASLLGLLVGGLIAALVFGAMVAAGGPVALKVLTGRRRKQFADQLADTLQLITGNLRAGHSILQAIDSVATDSPSPTKEEFERLVVEVRLGRDLPDALRALHERIGNQDFEWFVQALQIHREVGGDLAEILDTVAGTIRERGRLKRHVSTLSAEGRLSAAILFLLPFVMGFVVSILNPEYSSELFQSPIGYAMIGGACVLMTGGFFWLRRVIRIDL